jgi:hypothetical protein
MNARIAAKIVRRAHPERYTRAQVWRALDVVQRRSARVPAVLTCECPAEPSCRRFRLCQLDCTAQVLAMDLDSRRHPWGEWKCLAQRLTENR